RTRYITRIRQLARAVADGYVDWRASLNYPLLRNRKADKHVDTQALPCPKMETAENFLLEIGAEELPA
ncbi:glycyl-tRNA synthetase beta subunit, partial [Chlamydia psittaci 84-8471/1]